MDRIIQKAIQTEENIFLINPKDFKELGLLADVKGHYEIPPFIVAKKHKNFGSVRVMPESYVELGEIIPASKQPV